MEVLEENEKNNKITEVIPTHVIKPSNECEINPDTDKQEISISETEIPEMMEVPEENEKNNKITEVIATHAIKPSNECEINRNPDTGKQEMSVSETEISKITEVPEENEKNNKITEVIATHVMKPSIGCEITPDTDKQEISVSETEIPEMMEVPEENEKNNKITEVIKPSNECEMNRNPDTDRQEISVSETEISKITEVPEENEKNNKITEVIATHVIKPSNECEINRNPDIDKQEISVSGTEISNKIVQSESAKINNNNRYRHESDSWSDDDDSSSTSDTSSDSDFCQILIESSAPKKIAVVKTKGELQLEDLPPIEDLIITVKEDETVLIGKIHAIVDKLVVIHAIKDMKPLDLDSVLFLSYDRPLGRVFDIFGPVVEPFYCVRFNSTDDISDKGVEIGLDVFFAPEKNDITTYVFLDDLQRQKGSDASWKDNNEPPEEFLDFSDDEEEKAAKRKRTTRNRNRQFSNNCDVASKRPALFGNGNSSPQSNNRNCSAPPRNIQSNQFSRHNLFSTPPPVRNSFNCSSPNQMHFQPQVARNPIFTNQGFPRSSSPVPQIQGISSNSQRPISQNIFQRAPSLFTTYPQPPVFGQMALLSPVPSPTLFHTPVTNISNLIPASQAGITPHNYFNQRFMRNPPPFPQAAGNPIFTNQGFPRSSSPIPQIQGIRVSSNPWLPNRSPETFRVPHNHPLTVQIPNQNNPSVSMQTLQPNVPLQQFVNNGNVQSRFY